FFVDVIGVEDEPVELRSLRQSDDERLRCDDVLGRGPSTVVALIDEPEGRPVRVVLLRLQRDECAGGEGGETRRGRRCRGGGRGRRCAARGRCSRAQRRRRCFLFLLARQDDSGDGEDRQQTSHGGKV